MKRVLKIPSPLGVPKGMAQRLNGLEKLAMTLALLGWKFLNWIKSVLSLMAWA
jgi:hypothetical protein